MVRLPVILFLALFCCGCGKPSERVEAPQISREADGSIDRAASMEAAMPTFSGPSLSGDSFDSESLLGKVSIVNFWATWCGPCIVEIPEFVALYDEWSDRPFEIVGIASDWEGFDVVRPFAEDFLINYPVISDADGEIGEAFGGVYALPTTFLVDANGIVVRRYLGLFPFEEMRSELETMLDAAGAP